MQTRVTQLLKIELPIIQGGLAYLAYSKLAAAVSNAGGLGQITAMSLPDENMLREEIHHVKSLTTKPFGVNFAIGQHGRPYEHMLEAAIEENVPVISMTGGNPAPLLKRLENTKIQKLVLVASTRQAQKAESLGADAVMAVGQEGGGHIGKHDTGTFVLIPQVAESVSIPVIASGGIGDGKGLMAALALGAEGVEMGTRFIAVKECEHAHSIYKQKILDASEQDTIVIKREIGAPGRALLSPFTEEIVKMEKEYLNYDAIKHMVSGEANQRFIYEGNDKGFGWAGQVAGRIHDIPSVQELMDRIVFEANEVQMKWQNCVNESSSSKGFI